MASLRILYFGDLNPGCTSLHRCEALKRLGHEVTAYNPKSCLPGGWFHPKFNFKTGFVFSENLIRRETLAHLEKQTEGNFDVLWVDNGEAVSARLLRDLRSSVTRMVNYNCDDATGKRDGLRWLTFRKAIPEYDLCAVVRQPNVAEYLKYGARKVIRVMMSADEVAHLPLPLSPAIRAKWSSDVAFIGTWMPERGPFLLQLKNAGVPLAIWGNRWSKAPEWSQLKPFWRGPALSGNDYSYAIQCAKINLGLVSKGNRDEHTTRSAEIPALGSVLCAERTSEHLLLYKEGSEAIFWTNSQDCASSCVMLLEREDLLVDIAAAGHKRWRSGNLRNQLVLKNILDQLQEL